MIVNFTHKYQFTARLKVNNSNIDIVDSMKILGTTLNNQLDWNQNCRDIVSKVNKRMVFLRKIRILEQVKVKWSTSGSNTADLY